MKIFETEPSSLSNVYTLKSLVLHILHPLKFITKYSCHLQPEELIANLIMHSNCSRQEYKMCSRLQERYRKRMYIAHSDFLSLVGDLIKDKQYLSMDYFDL